MKVWVVTTGQASYEDGVSVVGVYKDKETALMRAKQEADISRDNSHWGDYWYDIEEMEVE